MSNMAKLQKRDCKKRLYGLKDLDFKEQTRYNH